MVVYIKSDLEFILKQIKISEAHALYLQTNGAQGAPLFGPSLNANPLRFRPTTSPGACGRSTGPTTTCCPVRSSGARRIASFPS